MSRHTTWAFFASSCTLLTLACYAPTTHAGGWGVFSKPTTDVDRLATQIDKLERHLEEYGSVVPKTPDVWGEARLTKYRKVIEKELATRENQFSPTINGAISRSDQAFLASTMALQAAVSGRSAVMTTPLSNVVVSTSNAGTSKELIETSQTDRTTQERINIPSQGVATSLPSAETSFQTVGGTTVNFGTSTTISLEPTLDLNQRFRYLQHLNEFRRINDGDDTSDSPGYALHLIRIPISILPGRKTEEGYGAEITITAKPHLHEKLLQVTFEQLVINDIVDQLSFPLVKFLDSAEGQEVLKLADTLSPEELPRLQLLYSQLTEEIAQLECQRKLFKESLTHATDKLSELGVSPQITSQIINSQNDISNALIEKLPVNSDAAIGVKKYKEIQDAHSDSQIQTLTNQAIENNKYVGIVEEAKAARAVNFRLAAIDDDIHRLNERIKPLQEQKDRVEQQIAAITSLLERATTSVSLAPFRRATLPTPQTQITMIHNLSGLKCLANLINRLKSEPIHNSQLNILDVYRMLNEETSAAYRLLQAHDHLFSHCTPELAKAIRAYDCQAVNQFRDSFEISFDSCFTCTDDKSFCHQKTLTWAIIVEAALLNERLIDDMTEIATAKDCQCLDRSWHEYFRPTPSPEAIHNFNEYVRCRWPIHVFAVDPITEDQNIADSFAQRREMQLALSMAFTSGRMSAQKFFRYARQTSLDVDTIALNRTVVGFSHGDDTFGWRFYPRVQTPKTPGNATVVFRDMLYGGLTQDQLLCQRRLEPGQRECTALVIMPSFVPYCTFDMRSNWFKLANPQKKELDLRDGVGISRDIVELRQASATCVKQAHLYRAEDLNHLNRAVDQLESRLPLQTSYVQIPYENSLGGFEFFNTGVTDLAPELKGFYGEPGIDTTKDTTIFVVGDHFSIHETQVIAGNQASQLNVTTAATANDVRFELLSRQIMRVTIPANTHTYTTKDSNGKPLELVDLHVATPYGVSNHLSIPVIKSSAQTQAKAAADAAKAEVAKALVASGISYKWKQDAPINATYCTNNSALSINFSNSDIDPTSTQQIISDSPQSSIFDPTPEPQLAVIVTGLDANGKAIPGQQWTYTPDFVHDSAAQSGPIAFELSVSVPGAPGSPLTLTLPTRKILQNIQASLAGSVLTPQAPAALQLQGYLRFGGDGAPIMALTNNLLIKLSPINCAPSCIPETTSNLNSLFTPVATSPPQPSRPQANTPQPKPTLADRYRTPQQATITPPLIAQ